MKRIKQLKIKVDPERPYNEFFRLMLKRLADPNCKHCYGRGYVGYNEMGFEVYCNARGCLFKTIHKYQSLSKNIKYKMDLKKIGRTANVKLHR